MMSLCLVAALAFGAGDEVATPYDIDPLTDGALTIGTTLFLVILDGLVKSAVNTAPACELVEAGTYCDPGHLNALDATVVGNDSETWRQLSNVGIGVVYALPLILGAWDSFAADTQSPWGDWGTDLLVITEAGLLTTLMTSVVKYAVRRPRPTQYHPDMPNRFGTSEHQLSFPSGHTSVAAAVSSAYAMTFSLRHPDSAWRWAVYGGAGLATVFTAYSRVAAGMHFYTDVLGGIALGTTLGLLVPWVHRKGVTLIPIVHAEALGAGPVQGMTASIQF
jgi:membrane-associated phospholipid phosphatase